MDSRVEVERGRKDRRVEVERCRGDAGIAYEWARVLALRILGILNA